MVINSNSEQVITDGLVFSLDAETISSSPVNWLDLSGNNNDGTLVNSPTFVNTTPKYFNLNGSNQYINMGSIDLQRDWTLEGWFYLDTQVYEGLFGQGTSITNQGLHIGYYSNSRGMIHALWSNDNDYQNNFRPGTDRWYHFVFTYNHTTYNKEFYVDGNLIQPGSSTENQYQGSGNLIIGGTLSSADNPLDGRVAVARMYNKVLSADEVKNNYNSLAKRFDKNRIPTVDFYLGENKLNRVYRGSTELYNIKPTPFVQDGLQLYLDPSDTNSYPGTGNDWFDLSGNDRHMRWNSVSWDSGGYFNTLNRQAKSIGDYSHAYGITNNTGYTIIVAYYVTTLTANSLFKFYSSNGSGAEARGIFVHPSWTIGTIYFDQGGCCDSNERMTYSSISSGQWYVVGLRSSVNNRHILLNGSGVVATNTVTAKDINLTTTKLDIGTTDESTMNGRIGIFAAYNRAISDDEFAENYNAIKSKYGLN